MENKDKIILTKEEVGKIVDEQFEILSEEILQKISQTISEIIPELVKKSMTEEVQNVMKSYFAEFFDDNLKEPNNKDS